MATNDRCHHLWRDAPPVEILRRPVTPYFAVEGDM